LEPSTTPHIVVRAASTAAEWYGAAGDRQGQLLDPFGHEWGLAQHIRDVPPDEIAATAAEALAS